MSAKTRSLGAADSLALFRAGLSGEMDPKTFASMLDSLEVRAGAVSYFTVPPEAEGFLAEPAEEPADGEA